MSPVKVYPDSERAAREWIRSLASINALGVKTNFSYNNVAGQKQIVLRQVAGSPDNGELPVAIARIQHDCWGEKKLDSRQIADLLVGEAESVATLGSRPVSVTGAVIHGVTCVMGPLWSPDPVDQRPRYIVDLQYTLRAA